MPSASITSGEELVCIDEMNGFLANSSLPPAAAVVIASTSSTSHSVVFVASVMCFSVFSSDAWRSCMCLVPTGTSCDVTLGQLTPCPLSASETNAALATSFFVDVRRCLVSKSIAMVPLPSLQM